MVEEMVFRARQGLSLFAAMSTVGVVIVVGGGLFVAEKAAETFVAWRHRSERLAETTVVPPLSSRVRAVA